MSTVVIYHNPRCSKSRATLALLNDRDIEPRVIEYLKTSPDAKEIAALVAALGVAPTDVIRFGEATAKELNLRANDKRSDAEWFALIAEHPILLQRPIVVVGERAAIGRPPEQVLALLT